MTEIDSIWPGWHIEELIGQGSYGRVYRISREVMGLTSYAAAKLIEVPQDESEISILASMGMDNLSIRTYLENTARSIVSEIAVMEELKGAKNVVSIEDYRLVEHEGDVGWTIWIRMELLEGLVEFFNNNGNPTVDESIDIALDVCNALVICHEHGIIHRDVKPENIFRDSFGCYKLGDFGIAKQIEASTRSTYSQKGTQHYMAPEVVRGERYDETVDLYSLGLMLYRFLNGMRFPFLPPVPEPVTPDDFQESLFKRLRGDRLPPPQNADPGLSHIVLRACAADRDERYSSADEMLTDLHAWRSGDYAYDENNNPKLGGIDCDTAEDNAGIEKQESVPDTITSKTSGDGEQATALLDAANLKMPDSQPEQYRVFRVFRVLILCIAVFGIAFVAFWGGGVPVAGIDNRVLPELIKTQSNVEELEEHVVVGDEESLRNANTVPEGTGSFDDDVEQLAEEEDSGDTAPENLSTEQEEPQYYNYFREVTYEFPGDWDDWIDGYWSCFGYRDECVFLGVYTPMDTVGPQEVVDVESASNEAVIRMSCVLPDECEILSEEDVVVRSYPSRLVEYLCSRLDSNGREYQARELVLVIPLGDLTYVFKCSTPADIWRVYEETFNAILNSITINEQPESEEQPWR